MLPKTEEEEEEEEEEMTMAIMTIIGYQRPMM